MSQVTHIPILNLEEVHEFREVFEQTYLNQELSFEEYPVKFFPQDFDHICFEPASGGQYKSKFSFRRARRLLLIREICNRNVPYILIHQVERDNKSVCVLCENAEFALYLIPKQSDQGPYFRIGTIIAYGQKIESKIEKQKNAGVLIERVKEVFSEDC